MKVSGAHYAVMVIAIVQAPELFISFTIQGFVSALYRSS